MPEPMRLRPSSSRRTMTPGISCVRRLKRYFGPDKPLDEIDSEALMAFVNWRRTGRDGEQLTRYTERVGSTRAGAQQQCK